MYHDFLGPSGLQGTHMDKTKKFKIDNIHCVREVSLHFGQSWPIVRRWGYKEISQLIFFSLQRVQQSQHEIDANFWHSSNLLRTWITHYTTVGIANFCPNQVVFLPFSRLMYGLICKMQVILGLKLTKKPTVESLIELSHIL